MSAVEVKPIELPGDVMTFIRPWWNIYGGDPMWVAPLIMDRKKFFDPRRNPYFKFADIQCFVAWKDGEVQGTIAATVDHHYQKVEQGVGFLGFFEFVDDEGVARALLEAACGFLRAKGMTEVRGPYNFNPNHDFGLLVDGFDTPPCIANPHARRWYGPMYEKIGLVKKADWYAYWMDAGPVPEQVARVSERFMKRHPEVKLRQVDMANFQREVTIFHDIYNDAWEDNWGHVHLSEEEFQALAVDFKQVIDPRLCWIASVNDEPVALSVTLPDYNQVFRKMNGSLFPFGWYHFLFGRKKIDQLRVFILGVKRKYQKMPLGAPLYIKTWEAGLEMGVRGAEASLIVESNFRMRGALEKLGGRIYKTYRIYGRDLA
jgi:GNAT superfamily N-acetyltransferase